MAYLPVPVHHLFARQHGVASSDQLLAAGMSLRQIETHSQHGSLISVVRGAYRSASVAETELARCAALCLAHRHAAIAGPTAGRLWGYRKLPLDRRIHLIAPRHSHPSTSSPWTITYHTDAIRPDDVVQRPDGIRITSQARTAMDLARWLSDRNLRSVIEQAMADGNLTAFDLQVVGVDFVQRRPWIRRYLDTVGSRINGGPAESHAELVVGEKLLASGISGLVRQHRLQTRSGIIRFDLAVPALKWAIEVDVFPTHSETAGRAADAERDQRAAERGWSVSRLSRDDYHHDLDASVQRLAIDYQRRSSPAA